jgi:uncharacterized protein (DUF2132 family)
MADEQPNNPLHGVKLKEILVYLEAKYGWEELGQRINIRCFTHDPSMGSSLKFLRRTPWARNKVEQLYLTAKRSQPGILSNWKRKGED